MVTLKLKQMLEERGMTQKDFAALVGISTTSVSKLCNNPDRIRLHTIDLICKNLNVTPQNLFEYKGE